MDFGTSNTVAVLAGADGRVRPLILDGQQQMASAVCAQPDGSLLAGRPAVYAARRHPDRFEPHPKRHIDDGVLSLGNSEWPIVDVISAVLGRVAAEAAQVVGFAPFAETVITHPATWAGPRRGILAEAAAKAGLGSVRLVAEPIAAAAAFAADHPERLPPGRAALVYDLGAGTFDAAVVRAEPTGGFTVLAADGLSDAGGLDIDYAIIAYLTARSIGHTEAWERLRYPKTREQQRARWEFLDDVRTAKELLTVTNETFIHVPFLDEETPFGRTELDELSRPLIERTLGTCRSVLWKAGLTSADLHAVFLVGGASRTPGITPSLHRALQVEPLALDQPELLVALGSLQDSLLDDSADPTPSEPDRDPSPGGPSPLPGPSESDGSDPGPAAESAPDFSSSPGPSRPGRSNSAPVPGPSGVPSASPPMPMPMPMPIKLLPIGWFRPASTGRRRWVAMIGAASLVLVVAVASVLVFHHDRGRATMKAAPVGSSRVGSSPAAVSPTPSRTPSPTPAASRSPKPLPAPSTAAASGTHSAAGVPVGPRYAGSYRFYNQATELCLGQRQAVNQSNGYVNPAYTQENCDQARTISISGTSGHYLLNDPSTGCLAPLAAGIGQDGDTVNPVDCATTAASLAEWDLRRGTGVELVSRADSSRCLSGKAVAQPGVQTGVAYLRFNLCGSAGREALQQWSLQKVT